MRKRLAIILSIIFVAFIAVEWYTVCLWSQDISLAGYFSEIFADISQTITGQQSDKLIRVNLYNYSLALYDGGQLIKQDKIAAAGNPANAPTPTGTFKILSKEKKHISGLCGLVMPWSLRFYKGYYLHDLPTYRSGQPYYSTYSSGCIRLSNELAPEVFNWADIGTKVEIYNSELVRAQDDPTVYVLTKDGWRKPIPSPEIFEAHGYKWSNIAIIPMTEIQNYPLGNPME